MTPEQLATVISQLGIAAIFVVAWFRSENQRDKERVDHLSRYDKLQIDYHHAQDAHRSETLQLVRDLTLGRDLRASIPIPPRDDSSPM